MTTTSNLPGDGFALLSLREVADILRVVPMTIRRLVAKRDLPVYRFARRMFFQRADIMRWLNGHRIESNEHF